MVYIIPRNGSAEVKTPTNDWGGSAPPSSMKTSDGSPAAVWKVRHVLRQRLWVPRAQ